MASSSSRSCSSASAHPSNKKYGAGDGESKSGKTKRGRGVDDEGWGGFRNYMDAKKQKLNDQFHSDKQENQSNIFEGVRIYVNGYTKPSSDELRRIMQKHGGKYEMYLSKSRVTHIVATNLPNSKLHQAKTMPVVKPEWITESVTAGRQLPHKDYLLFGKQSKLQSGLKFHTSATSMSRSSSNALSHSEESAFTQIKDRVSPTEEKFAIQNKKVEKGTNERESPQESSKRKELNESMLRNMSIESQMQECDQHSDNKMGEDNEGVLNNPIKLNPFVEERAMKSNKNSLMEEAFEKNQPEKEKELEQEENILSSGEDSDIILDSGDEKDSPWKLDRLNFPARWKGTTQGDFGSSTSSNAHNGESLEAAGTANKDQTSSKTLNKTNTSDLKVPPQEDLKDGSRPKSARSLASPPKPVSSSATSMARAGDKQFLSEFYSNSRLHHLSTWGAEFKAYVAEIQKSKGGCFPGRERLRQTHVENVNRLGMPETLETARHSRQERTIMHIDMDCFFVSVGLLSRPDLRGKPVAVTHSRGQGSKPDPASDAAWEKAEWQKKRDGKLKTQTIGTGNEPAGVDYDCLVTQGSTGMQTFHSMAEIASCSYEAREQGVKNGMFMGRARSLCPDLHTIPYNFAEYNRISKILYDTVASYTHDIEAVSCDEMLLDCTDLLADTGATAMEFASLLRSEMADKTGCTASTGIGPNILLARLATRKAKPNGQFQVLRYDAQNFIKDQDVSDLPGVGYSMTRKLSKLGVKICGDLQAIPVGRLRSEFGPKTGESLHQFSLGQDDREVRGDKQRKSVSADVNYGIRFTKESEAVTFLQELSNEVHQRLVKIKVKGHVITLKLMVRRPDAPKETKKFMGHGICNTINKSTNLPVATNDGILIGREVIAMYKSHNVSAADIRGIGIQIQKLEPENSQGYRSAKQLREHQSILNFAVSEKGNAHMSKSPTKLVNRETSSATSSVENKKISERALANCLPPDQIDLDTLTDVSFLLSPSQVNADVLKELPEEIANEIRADMKQHGKKGNLRSSKSSNSDLVLEDQPGPSHSSANTAMDVSTYRGERSEISNYPSASQVDTDVLKELPQEVANEIRADMEQHRNSKKDSWSSPSSSSVEKQPGVSHYPPGVSRPIGESCDAFPDLPSLSQVDFGCFQALPKHMQMEIQAAYTKQQRKSEELKERTSLTGTALGQLKSPTKDKTGKQNKAGKRRGRPPGKKKLTFSDLQSSKAIQVKDRPSLGSKSDTAMTNEIIIVDDPEPNDEMVEQPDQHGALDVDFEDTESVLTRNSLAAASVVSFCGAETVSDVRHLLKEWLKSSPDPGEDDVAMVTDYLMSLIKGNFLEQAYCHLRFLIRRVNSTPSLTSWTECVDSIASYVQSSVWDLYGSDLKLHQ